MTSDRAAPFRRLYIRRHIESGGVVDDRFIGALIRRYGRERTIILEDIKAARREIKREIDGRAFYAQNRDRLLVEGQNKRCARLGVVGALTVEAWQEVCAQHANRCALCAESKPLTIDHIQPLSKGGTNWIDNVQPLCKPCNSRKNNRI